jgi:hypothetical protein
MRAVVVEKQHDRSKSVKARRAYVRFLEREVYTFCGERVRGAMLRARIFLFVGGPQGRVVDRPRMGRGQHARACGQSNIRGAARKSCAGKREERCFFFFSGKDWKDVCFALWVETEIGSQRSRPWVWAPPRKRRARNCGSGGVRVETQLVEGCGRRTQLIQLIYLRYLCGSAEREK